MERRFRSNINASVRSTSDIINQRKGILSVKVNCFDDNLLQTNCFRFVLLSVAPREITTPGQTNCFFFPPLYQWIRYDDDVC